MHETRLVHLWLLRHAKSSWDRPELDDHERPLAPRGARAAALLRDYLGAEGIHPDLLLCSSALRARETLTHILPALGSELVIRIERAVYRSDAADLVGLLRQVADGVGSVMLIGHNPAVQELATTLAGSGDKLSEVTSKFPTGALAEIEFPSDRWSALAEGSGEVARFVIPRDL